MGRNRVPDQVRWLVAAVLGFAGVVLGYGMWDRDQRGPVVISTDPTLGSVTVEVRGAVVRPGVYTLPEGGRVGQLVEQAGGLTPDADLRSINMARRLADEELVTVPSKAATVATPGSGPTAAGGPQPADDGLVNVNTAIAAQLEELPGIGEVLAERIVAYRETNGPFLSIDDLTRVEGISEGVVEELRDLITAGP